VLSFSPVVGIGTHPQASVPPPHTLWTGGRAHSLAGEGLGESQIRRGDIHCGSLYTVYKFFVVCTAGLRWGRGQVVIFPVLAREGVGWRGRCLTGGEGRCLSPLICSESEFVNVKEARESIPRNRFRQLGGLASNWVVVPVRQAANRFLGSFTNSGSVLLRGQSIF
jgi:hypothetical protein